MRIRDSIVYYFLKLIEGSMMIILLAIVGAIIVPLPIILVSFAIPSLWEWLINPDNFWGMFVVTIGVVELIIAGIYLLALTVKKAQHFIYDYELQRRYQ